MNISSLVVDVRPEYIPAFRATVGEWPGVEIQADTPEGKMILTIETDDDTDTTHTFSRINAMDGVMSVAMVYHQFEPDPEQEVLHGIDAT